MTRTPILKCIRRYDPTFDLQDSTMRLSAKFHIVDLAVSSSVVETDEGRCALMWTALHGLNYSSPGSILNPISTLYRFNRICERVKNN